MEEWRRSGEGVVLRKRRTTEEVRTAAWPHCDDRCLIAVCRGRGRADQRRASARAEEEEEAAQLRRD